MAEQLVNEFTVNRPIDEAWPVICDLERIAPCLPGAQLQEIEGDEYRGIVKVKLGAVATQFKGAASFTSRDDANYTAALHAEGRDTGGRGNAAAEITARAEALSATSTRIEVVADLHITGKVAQFGRGILGDVSKKLMTQFATNLNAMLDEAEPAESAATSETAASDSEETTDPASGAATASDTAQDATAPHEPEAPKVRKIDGPASEPIDMAGMAGPALAKRFGPVLVVLVLALLLLRRRSN
jgi:carbon monoxide dehydrogenase subunit G